MNSNLIAKLKNMGAETDDVIERMTDDSTADGREIAEQEYLKYLLEFPDNKNIVALKAAVAAADAEKAKMEVHTLKGIALNLGLLSLSDVCMDMLLDLRAGKSEQAFGELGEIDECFDKWAQAINQEK